MFEDSEFLSEFMRVCGLVLVHEPGFGRVRSSDLTFGESWRPYNLIIFSKMFIVVGFVGSEFGIFGGFGWVRSSVLVGKPGFGMVRSSDLEFGELWRTLDILFWTQYHLIFG